jgi:hypothetical protein
MVDAWYSPHPKSFNFVRGEVWEKHTKNFILALAGLKYETFDRKVQCLSPDIMSLLGTPIVSCMCLSVCPSDNSLFTVHTLILYDGCSKSKFWYCMWHKYGNGHFKVPTGIMRTTVDQQTVREWSGNI